MSVLSLIYVPLWPAISSHKSFRCSFEEIFETHFRSHKCLKQKKKGWVKRCGSLKTKCSWKKLWGKRRESSKITFNRSNYYSLSKQRKTRNREMSVRGATLPFVSTVEIKALFIWIISRHKVSGEHCLTCFNTFKEILIEFLSIIVFIKLFRFNLSLICLILLSCCM